MRLGKGGEATSALALDGLNLTGVGFIKARPLWTGGA
jgi:hypothetical protein